MTNPTPPIPRPPARRGPAARRRARRGFTLIESALATVIIGVGVLALVEAQQAFLRSNAWSTQSATAFYLANEVRELTRRLPRHDPVNGLYLDSGTLRGWGPRAGDQGPADFAYLTAFDGLRFSAAGTAGWADGDLPGPIDAFGAVIPDVDATGSVRTGPGGQPLPLQGWTQRVVVQKVSPTDPTVTYTREAVLAPDPGSGFKGLAVDQFPLRVTVIVTYRGPFDAEETEMARVSWIAP